MEPKCKFCWEYDKNSCKSLKEVVVCRPESELDITGILKNWTWDKDCNVFRGTMIKDSRQRFEDGTYVHTSHVIAVDPQTSLVQTLNSLYLLGDRHPDGRGDLTEIADYLDKRRGDT